MTPAPHYVLVYEFSPFLLANSPMILLGLLVPLAVWIKLFPAGSAYDRVVISFAVLMIWSVMGWGTVNAVNRHLETIARIDAGDTRVAEGEITGAHCVGKARQAYTVAGESFVPSDLGFQPGFESAAVFSNSVVNGMRVRVHFFDGSWGVRVITKLENDATTGIRPPGVKLFGPCGA